jgi:ATP-dependent RNA helicase DeaD
VALFSATMAAPIRRIAARHLRSPVEVTIKSKTTTATNIRQRYWMVSGMHKLDALTRILEAEDFDGMLVFTRTKQGTVELAEKLEARGFAAAPLNGDIAQPQRERTVARLKAGQIDILVATDVAARGLDVERIGHVVNYDVPYDTESYVHRIGRTGRAGRKGEAILFIAPRERNMLRAIERATRQVIEPMNLPSVDAVNALRIAKFKQRILDTASQSDARALRAVVEQLEAESGLPLIDIAAALASLAQGTSPLLLGGKTEHGADALPGAALIRDTVPSAARPRSVARAPRAERSQAAGPRRPAAPARAPEAPAERLADRLAERLAERLADRPTERLAERLADRPAERQPTLAAAPAAVPVRKPRPKSAGSFMETFRIEVGSTHGIKPSHVVGAIANEAGIEGVHIGRVDIREDHSFVDLPEGMPKQVFKLLQKVLVAGRELRLSKVDEKSPKSPKPPRTAAAPLEADAHRGRKMLSRRVVPTRGKRD